MSGYDVVVESGPTITYNVTVESPAATYVVAVSYARGPQGPVGPKGDPGSVDSVTAGDSTIVVGGTATAPTVRANTGTTAGTVAAGDDSRIVGAVQAASLGSAAYKNTGTTAGTVAAGDDSRIVKAVQSADQSITNMIKLAKAAAVPGGTPAGTIIFRTAT